MKQQQVADLSPSDLTTCPRCGITRRRNPKQPPGQRCIDCRTVENPGPQIRRQVPTGNNEFKGKWVRVGQVWKPVMPPERLSAEDLAWCEQAAEIWRRQEQERANRRGYWTRTRKDAA